MVTCLASRLENKLRLEHSTNQVTTIKAFQDQLINRIEHHNQATNLITHMEELTTSTKTHQTPTQHHPNENPTEANFKLSVAKVIA